MNMTVLSTKRLVSLLTVTGYCLSACSISAQAHSDRAKHVHPHRSSLKHTGRSKQPRLLPYPFNWLISSSRGPIEKGEHTDKRAVVTIDMKEFWNYRTPYKDQQKLSRQSARDYIKYVWDHVTPPVPEPSPK